MRMGRLERRQSLGRPIEREHSRSVLHEAEVASLPPASRSSFEGHQLPMLNQLPPGPCQLKPSPHVPIVRPSLITAISP
jgi:hypothetical protein